MGKRRFLDFTTVSGERATLTISPDGKFFCPICGDVWGEFPPFESFDICPTCETEYGFDDSATTLRPHEPLAKRLIRLRIEWLDRIGWTGEALGQLRDNLSVTEEQARSDAEEMRRT